MENKDLGTTSIGMQPNLAALLCYVPYVGIIIAIVFFILEKENKFVRFYAMQSIILFATLFVLHALLFPLALVPYIGFIAGYAIFAIGVILSIVLMVKAYQGEYFKLPIAGDIAEKNS